MEVTINLKKAKLIEGDFLELEYTQTETEGESVSSTDYKAFIRKYAHVDLLHAFEKLKTHLAFLTESVDIKDNDLTFPPELESDIRFSKFKVTQISLGGSDDSYGVTLTGQRKLKGKKILNLNAPFTKFEEQDGVDNYDFLHELYSDIQTVINEVILYLNGKHAPDPQLDLFESKEKFKETIKDMKDKGIEVSVSIGKTGEQRIL